MPSAENKRIKNSNRATRGQNGDFRRVRLAAKLGPLIVHLHQSRILLRGALRDSNLPHSTNPMIPSDSRYVEESTPCVIWCSDDRFEDVQPRHTVYLGGSSCATAYCDWAVQDGLHVPRWCRGATAAEEQNRSSSLSCIPSN